MKTMNRFAAIFLTGFYLIATIGVAINVHYCHGKVASVSVYLSADACACGKMMGKKHCCDDQTFLFQLEEDQRVSESLVFAFTGLAPAIPASTSEVPEVKNGPGILPLRSPDPPPPQHPSWLLHQAFIFYG